MHLGTMRSYSFSTLLTRCDVLRNLSHWIYYCKSRSSACKNPVCSQTAQQETSGNIRTACLITPQLLEGMPRPTASAFAQNSAKVHKAALAWDLQGEPTAAFLGLSPGLKPFHPQNTQSLFSETDVRAVTHMQNGCFQILPETHDGAPSPSTPRHMN